MRRCVWCLLVLLGMSVCVGLSPSTAQVRPWTSRGSLLPFMPVFQPVLNPVHSSAQGLLSMWIALPGLSGGVQWYDVVRGRNLTLTAMTTPGTTGWGRTVRPGGYAEVRFDGTATAARRPAADSVYSFVAGGQDQPFSVMCWVWFVDITLEAGLVMKSADLGSNEEWMFRNGGSTNLAFLVGNGGTNAWVGQNVALTTALYQGQWVHVAATYDGSETAGGIQMYRNGVPQTGTPSAQGTYIGMTAGPRPLTIGSYDGRQFLKGFLDDVRLYTRKLSATELLAIYQQSQAGNPDLVRRIGIPVSPLWQIVGQNAFFPFFRPPHPGRQP